MKLKDIAHARTGDKGEISNISVIPYNEKNYSNLQEYLTADKVKEYFADICKGEVTRYDIPGVKALNFVLDKTLGGGVTRSLALDKHGKTLGMALLEMEIPGEWDTLEKELKTETMPEADAKEILGDVKTIRIGSGAGYAGDRSDAALELAENGQLDYLILECLAERTIALGQKAKQKNPSAGYNALLEDRLEKLLPVLAEKKIRLVTNMGSANPLAAGKKIKELAGRLHINHLKISCVLGDDVGSNLDNYLDNDILENGQKLGEIKDEIVSANAYTGAEGIVEALQNGADIVITGRVADPALTVGIATYEFGWDISNHPNQMGQAVLAGHLLECAGQVTGGYYADPGYKDVSGLEHLGFPIVEIAENGRFVVTKTPTSGGLVSVDTCKEQMIYEIHNPVGYMTPDAIADFSKVTFTQVGKDMVLAEHATSHGKPATLKVSVGYQDCFIGEGEVSFGGSNCMDRAKLAAEIMEKRIAILNLNCKEYRVDYIGVDSLYRDQISKTLCDRKPAEVRVRFAGRFETKEEASRFAHDIETLYTNGPAGGGGITFHVNEVLSICSIFIPREDVTCQVKNLWKSGKAIMPFPIKGVLQGFPLFGDVFRKYIPEVRDKSIVEKLDDSLNVLNIKDTFAMSQDAYEALCQELIRVGDAFDRMNEEESAEFGVPVDLDHPCHQWSNYNEKVQLECVDAIERKYKGRKGEIIFYGPSNIQMWYSLEQDMKPFAAQNHGMGGCVDAEMIKYAPRMLYAFEPSVVFFQTGSNDLANGWTMEQIFDNKVKMYQEYLDKMPNTHLVIMSGLPLPGRQQFWENTVKINEFLKEMCKGNERLHFLDATVALQAPDGSPFNKKYFRKDGIHLNKIGHDIWTAEMKKILVNECLS